jgi:hypothetical protein
MLSVTSGCEMPVLPMLFAADWGDVWSRVVVALSQAAWIKLSVVVLSFGFAAVGAIAVNKAAGRNPALTRTANGTEAFTADKLLEAARIGFGFQLIVSGMILAFLVAVVTLALMPGESKIGDVIAVISSVTGIISTLIASFFGVQAAGAGRSQAMDLAVQQQAGTDWKIVPVGGPPGAPVSVTGNDLTSVNAVNFGAAEGQGLKKVNDGSLLVVAPPGEGRVDVALVYPNPKPNKTIGSFVYAPVVTALAQASGSSTGGDTVVVSGSGFTGATAVAFGDNAASALTVNSDAQITATSPAGSGIVDVVVTTPAGTSVPSSATKFSYTAPAGGSTAVPVVESVKPDIGKPEGGDPVTITGSGFAKATGVSFGASPASALSNVSDTQIIATSPAGNGIVDVTVTTPAATSAVSAAAKFTYNK